MEQNGISTADKISNFNTFVTEVRNRLETLIKQILVVSGGTLTITVGAFLTSTKPPFSETTIHLFKYAWIQLSASIILCLFLMALQVVALINVALKKKDKLKQSGQRIEVIFAWLPIRILNICVGLAAFGSCIGGIVFMSQAAISLLAKQA